MVSRLRASLRSLLASYLLVGSVEWVLAVALTTIVYDRTGSTGWVALTVALRFLPSVLVAPMGGVLADRMDRRRLMIWSCALRAAEIRVSVTPHLGKERGPSCESRHLEELRHRLPDIGERLSAAQIHGPHSGTQDENWNHLA